MKQTLIYIFLLLFCKAGFAQDFTGVITYKLHVSGSPDANTDSMSVVFDKERVMVILYIPDGTKISEKKFIDDLKGMKSFRLDDDKKTFTIDTLHISGKYKFINTNSIGAAVNNQLCLRYKAGTTAECLGGINYRNSKIKDYFFFGVQPLIVDNRIIMDFKETLSNGSISNITAYNIRSMENVDKYFDLWGYIEAK